MAKARLSDREAKNILLKWSERSKALWQTPSKIGYWMRAQPKPANVSISHPKLYTPRASLFSTQPDGLWVYFHDQDCCDVICVEVCGRIQNLYDKRSRYIPVSQSVVLSCPLAWLIKDVRLPKGGKKPL